MTCITTVVAYKFLNVVLLIMITCWLVYTSTPFFMFLIKNISFRQLSSLWIIWMHIIKDYPDPNMHIFKWIWQTDVMPKVWFSIKKMLSIWTIWIFKKVSIFLSSTSPLKKCGKISLDLATCCSHFEKLILYKCGNIVWQSVAWLGLEPNSPKAFRA